MSPEYNDETASHLDRKASIPDIALSGVANPQTIRAIELNHKKQIAMIFHRSLLNLGGNVQFYEYPRGAPGS
jgi:hypothetical protein